MGRPADFDNPEPLKVSSTRGLRLRLFSITSAIMLAATAVSSSVYGQGSDRAVDGVKPPIPNTTVPEVPVLDYGEDPFTEENIERRAQTLQPPKFVERYEGKDQGRELVLAAQYRRILAVALGYEAGGFAQAARELNEKTSEQYNPRNNTPNGMSRLTDYSPFGVAQVGLLAPQGVLCGSEKSDGCLPVNLDTPVTLIRGVRQKPLVTTEGREMFTYNNFVVLGNEQEVTPNRLDYLASIVYVNRSIVIGVRMMDTLVRSGVTDTRELFNITTNENSEFNVSVRTEALWDTLNSVETLRPHRSDWVSRPEFEELFDKFSEAKAFGGEEAAKQYLRKRSGLR